MSTVALIRLFTFVVIIWVSLNIWLISVYFHRTSDFLSAGTYLRLLKKNTVKCPSVLPFYQIPKIIHYSYKYDIWSPSNKSMVNIIWALAAKKWFQYFPSSEFQYMFWSDQDNKKCFEKWFKEYLDAFNELPPPPDPERMDVARYCILYIYGGIYTDLDIEPFTNFYEELTNAKISIIASPYEDDDGYQNSMMVSMPRTRFWLFHLHRIFVEGNGSSHTWSDFNFGTGPSTLSHSIQEYNMNQCGHIHELPVKKYHPNVHRSDWAHWLATQTDNPFNTVHWGTAVWAGYLEDGGDPRQWARDFFRNMHPECPGVTRSSPWDFCGDPRTLQNSSNI